MSTTTPTDYASVSYWLETAGDLTPRPALQETRDVDVAIMGAGYSGLWTAWYLLQRDPSLTVAICESEIAGFGASGRNGAWCSAGLSLSPPEIARRYSPDVARRTVMAMRDTVAEVGRVTENWDIDWRAAGVLRIARGEHEVPSLIGELDAARSLGLADDLVLLDAGATAERVRVGDARAALFDPHAAVIHPGKLVRRLAQAVEEAGATIYEHTRVESVQPGEGRTHAALHTAHGTVNAEALVLAGEAYTALLPKRRRALLPVYSLIVLTEPLTQEQWDRVGWQGNECLSSRRLTVDYLSRTSDGRIVFGGRGAPYHLGSGIHSAYDHHEATHAMLRRAFADWFPGLADVRFSHAWGGPLGMPRDFVPNVFYDRATGMAGAYGYTGQGVGTSNLAGRILADLIVGRGGQWADLPMTGHRSRRWEPEPLRWLGARYMQRAFSAIDARAARTGRPPTGRSLAERLMRH